MLGISRTLAYSLANEFLTTRSGLPCVRLGSRRIVCHALRWSAGRTPISRTRTTRRDSPEASDRSTCGRHRARDCRRDPLRWSARMGGPRPPLRSTDRCQQVGHRFNTHAGHRPRPQQGHMRASPSDASLCWPRRRRCQAHRAWSLRNDPVPAARPAQAHTYTDEPTPQHRAAATSRNTRSPSDTHSTDRAADAARPRLTDMRVPSRRQQPDKPMELHELASPMPATLLPSAFPATVRPCPVNRDTESYAC